MNRSDFQKLAEQRLAGAEVLLAAGRFDCTYYVSGYAVECALKACVARKTREGDFPPRDTKKIWTHSLVDLLDSAGLNEAINAITNEKFNRNWATAKDWPESSRHDVSEDSRRAEDMLDAVKNPENGMLQWLKQYW